MSDWMFDDLGTEVAKRKAGGSEMSVAEVYLIGHSFLNWVSTVESLGHASPASVLDYANPANPWGHMVQDFVAWTSGREDMAPGCEERLRFLVREGRWTDAGLASVFDELTT